MKKIILTLIVAMTATGAFAKTTEEESAARANDPFKVSGRAGSLAFEGTTEQAKEAVKSCFETVKQTKLWSQTYSRMQVKAENETGLAFSRIGNKDYPTENTLFIVTVSEDKITFKGNSYGGIWKSFMDGTCASLKPVAVN